MDHATFGNIVPQIVVTTLLQAQIKAVAFSIEILTFHVPSSPFTRMFVFPLFTPWMGEKCPCQITFTRNFKSPIVTAKIDGALDSGAEVSFDWRVRVLCHCCLWPVLDIYWRLRSDNRDP